MDLRVFEEHIKRFKDPKNVLEIVVCQVYLSLG